MELELRHLFKRKITDSYVSWLNNPEIRKYMGLRHKSENFTKNDVLLFVEDCLKAKRFHWGIYYNDEHIGNVSTSIWNQNDKWIDISYLIGNNHLTGKGIATKSVGAAINHLFTVSKYQRIQAECAVENIGSIKVMEKLGMKLEGTFRSKLYLPDEARYTDEVIYSVLANEWNPSREICSLPVEKMPWE